MHRVALLVCCLAVHGVAVPLDLNMTDAPVDAQNPDGDTRLVFGDEDIMQTSAHNVWHMEHDMYLEPGSILFAWGSSIKTTRPPADPTTEYHEIYDVAGSVDTPGYKEGVGKDARFHLVSNFIQLSKETIIIVDRWNHCLRKLERSTGTVSHYAGKCTVVGYADGDSKTAEFHDPSDILLDERTSNALIVVDDFNCALRSVDIKTRQTTTIIQDDDRVSRPRFATLDMDDKNILYLTVRHQITKVDLRDNSVTVIVGERVPVGFFDGKFEDALFGYWPAELVQVDKNHIAVADYWNREVRIVDLVDKTVTSLCPATVGNYSVPGDIDCTLALPHALMLHNDTLYVGDNSNIHKFSVASIPANQKPSTLSGCVRKTISASIANGETKAKVKIDKNITLMLSTGVHQYVYMVKGLPCTIDIVVKESADKCPQSISRVASPTTKTAVVDLVIGSLFQQFVLPIGSHAYYVKQDDLSCSFNINVLDADIERRVQFEVMYNFDCNGFTNNDVARKIVTGVAEHNYAYVLELCNGVCSRPAGSLPSFLCKNSTLTVTYPTDLVYGGDVTVIPDSVKNTLHNRIIAKGTMMSIVDTTRIPPVTFPITQPDGSSAKLILTSLCLNNKSYDSASDSCL